MRVCVCVCVYVKSLWSHRIFGLYLFSIIFLKPIWLEIQYLALLISPTLVVIFCWFDNLCQETSLIAPRGKVFFPSAQGWMSWPPSNMAGFYLLLGKTKNLYASRFYQLKTGHSVTGTFLERIGEVECAECWQWGDELIHKVLKIDDGTLSFGGGEKWKKNGWDRDSMVESIRKKEKKIADRTASN